MENVDKFHATISEYIGILEMEKTRLEQAKNSRNNGKVIAKIMFLEELLQTVPQTVYFDVEGCKGDSIIRDFCLPNTGSLVECVVKYWQNNKKKDEVSKTWYADAIDTRYNGCDYEIKASIGSNSLATPSKKETTILVNRVGVFSISKKQIAKYVNKQGRLPHSKACGKPDFKLMYRMGYDIEEFQNNNAKEEREE